MSYWRSRHDFWGHDVHCDWAVTFDSLFIVTFSTSVATASFGVSKFLKSGPMRIVRDDKCLMGFCTSSFILLFLNIAATLVGRGVMIGVYAGSVQSRRSDGLADGDKMSLIQQALYLLVVFLAFIPQLVHVRLLFSLRISIISIVLYSCRHMEHSYSPSASGKQHQ